MRKILITGAHGMLGQDLALAFSADRVYALDRDALDITDPSLVDRVINEISPDIVLNAAAYNLVDLVESPEGQKIATRVNVDGPRNLAESCAKRRIRFVHFSTDYVFFGDSTEPYTEDAAPRPCSAYGHTKLDGERAVESAQGDYLIIRTCRLFGKPGIGEVTKKSFVDLMIELAEKKSEISVVNEEIASPTYTVDLAIKTKELIDAGVLSGIYHVTNSGACTWYDFAQEIFQQIHSSVRIIPVSSAAFPRPARRPAFSALATTKTRPLRSWQEALREYLSHH